METNKIPTAEEFCLQHNIKALEMQSILSYVMIEFTKLHVKEALKTVAEKTNPEKGSYLISDKKTIIKSYPLENIK